MENKGDYVEITKKIWKKSEVLKKISELQASREAITYLELPLKAEEIQVNKINKELEDWKRRFSTAMD